MAVGRVIHRTEVKQMTEIHFDIETKSSVDLAKQGLYKYAESPDFDVLLLSYAVDNGKVQAIDLANGEVIPAFLIDALTNPNVRKIAHNASFERVCMSVYLRKKRLLGNADGWYSDGKFLTPVGWYCTMIQAAEAGLPMSLKAVGEALHLKEQKLSEGKELIQFFCVPKKDGTFNKPSDFPERWETFKNYNIRDVQVEMQIYQQLAKLPLSQYEMGHYITDQMINDYGICIDTQLVQNAIAMNAKFREQALQRAKEITGLDNPNSPLQVLGWLEEQGVKSASLDKEAVAELLRTTDGSVKEMLLLRQQLSKSSVKKYEAMQKVAASDDRARGLIQFYGATNTGRFSSKLIQVQNLPRNAISDLPIARELVKEGNYEAVELLYDSVPDVLSQLIRTAFIPSEGCRFIVADYSAIEARVIAWIAHEQWILDTFVNGGDIYCATAERMFHKPVVKHGVNGELRQKGKQASLACQYGGGTGAMKAMGALKLGMKEEELKPLVDAWRAANPKIVRLWYEVNDAVMDAVLYNRPQKIGNLQFYCAYNRLFIVLPSGRKLAYYAPQMTTNKFGNPSVSYLARTAAHKWDRVESSPGKWVENITQATARDLLAEAMRRITKRGFHIVMHVHDELIVDVPKGQSSVEELCEMMCENPKWADGLPLSADGFECAFYQKE